MRFLYLRNLKTTGAFVATSPKVESEITKNIKQEPALVLELGMGLGNITKKILQTLHPEGRLIAFELNSHFCEIASKEIKDERLTIINDSAANIKKHINEQVDYVISSLPLSIIPAVEDIFRDIADLMSKEATFSQVLLRKTGFKGLEHYLQPVSSVKVGYFPAYHIHHYIKKG